MRKLTLEEKRNLENNKDIIGEIALVLAQMDREQMKSALDVLIVMYGEGASERGELYNEEDIKW